MTAELRVVVSDTGSVLKIPNQALRFRPETADVGLKPQAHLQSGPVMTTAVWVVGTDGRPTAIAVRLGESDDSSTQLLDGQLAEGQPLIVAVAKPQTRAGFLGLRLGL
jgi:HlyD family secretion protein